MTELYAPRGIGTAIIIRTLVSRYVDKISPPLSAEELSSLKDEI